MHLCQQARALVLNWLCTGVSDSFTYRTTEKGAQCKAVKAANSSFSIFAYNEFFRTKWLSSLCSVIIFTEEWRAVAKTSNHVITQQLLFATFGNLPCNHSAFICAQVLSYCSACSPQNLFPSQLCAVTSSLFDLALRWDRLVKLQGERICFVLSLSSSRAKYYHMAQLPHLICWFFWTF